MKVRIVQTFTIHETDDGQVEIHDNDGMCMTRNATLEEAFDSIVEMVSSTALTEDVQAEIIDVIGDQA